MFMINTWVANEDNIELFIQIIGIATPEDQFLVRKIVKRREVVSISVKTDTVVGPVRVVYLIIGGEDELLIDAGRVARGEG